LIFNKNNYLWMDNSYKLNIILLDIFKFSCYENEIFAFFFRYDFNIISTH